MEHKTITINDFKMWLEGVEEMQEPDWTPSPTQWARIREKINSIGTQDIPQQRGQYPAYVPTVAPSSPPPAADTPVRPAGPSMMSSVPRQQPQQPLPGPFATGSEQIPVRTPNIDTVGKPYESAFA